MRKSRQWLYSLTPQRFAVPVRTFSAWSYVPLVAVIGLRLASAPTANLSYLLIAIYALLGRGHAVRALALSWLFTMISPGLAPEASGGPAARYLVLFAAAASSLIHGTIRTGNPTIRPITLATVLLGGLIVVHSLLFSQIVDVSILKAISWTVAAAALISCWTGMPAYEREETVSLLFWGLVLIMLFSLPLLVLPTGYLRNGWGFQGVLNHPQAFGPVMAVLGAWAATAMLARRNPAWLVVGLTGVCFVLVFLSGARTAGLALVGSVALSTVLVPWLAGQPVRQLFPGLASPRVWFVVAAALIAAMALAPLLVETVSVFITKSGSGGSLLDSYDQSRGKLIDRMIENILQRPITGIGFGIASDYTLMEVDRSGFLGLPTGAAVEKGVAFIAVLEELGVVVAGMILWWALAIIGGCAKGGLVPLTICMVVILFNFGEATFFSPGGMGMLWMILVTWAYAEGKARTRYV